MLPVSLPGVSTCVIFCIQISVLPTDPYFAVCTPTYRYVHTCISAGNKSVSSLKCIALVLWGVPFPMPLLYTSTRCFWFPVMIVKESHC